MSNGFDIAKYVRKVVYTRKDGTKQEKEILDTAPRLAWFRSDFPAGSGWQITTQCVNLDAEGAFFKAEIVDPKGLIIATGHKFVSSEAFGNYCEKAETQAIGRALQVAGYGTIYALERESDEEEPEAEGSQVTPKPKKKLSTASPQGKPVIATPDTEQLLIGSYDAKKVTNLFDKLMLDANASLVKRGLPTHYKDKTHVLNACKEMGYTTFPTDENGYIQMLAELVDRVVAEQGKEEGE